MSEDREFLTRQGVEYVFDMSRQFVDTWINAPEGGPIPPMPRLNVSPMKFHKGSVREWYLKYFQVGGGSDASEGGKV